MPKSRGVTNSAELALTAHALHMLAPLLILAHVFQNAGPHEGCTASSVTCGPHC